MIQFTNQCILMQNFRSFLVLFKVVQNFLIPSLTSIKQLKLFSSHAKYQRNCSQVRRERSQRLKREVWNVRSNLTNLNKKHYFFLHSDFWAEHNLYVCTNRLCHKNSRGQTICNLVTFTANNMYNSCIYSVTS